ncbi:SMI1/KNR4 family protein [Streptomyces sp. NPDC055189]
MAGRTGVEALQQTLPSDWGADEQVDWAAAEAQLGASLPSDYRDFMAIYGGGCIDDLIVLPPLPTGNGWGASIAGHAVGFHELWATEGGAPGVELGADRVLPWGSGGNANELGWLMAGPNPDQWPVIVWRRHDDPRWALIDCGMAEFLRRLMAAEFDECPLSDLSLWGRVGTFVHHEEQERRFHAGLDPMAGEPNPYADMFD